MRIEATSVYVDDQAKALAFYTQVLGFVVRDDVSMGPGMRWLSVLSPERPDGAIIVLEPSGKPATQAFKQAMYAEGTPLLLLSAVDIQAEHKRLLERGVTFSTPPTPGGPIIYAIFDDTCGNWVMIAQPNA